MSHIETSDFTIECIGEVDEWVYDLEVDDTHSFFANNILVHNSCYFRLTGVDGKTDDEIVARADEIGEYVNNAFPDFMREAFHCVDDFATRIRCGREAVAHSGIFITKKHYLLRLLDLEGVRIKAGDKKEMKAMGSPLKKADVPKVIQKFLHETMIRILRGAEYSEIEAFVMDMRTSLMNDPFPLGSVLSCNGLTAAYNAFKVAGKPRQDSKTASVRMSGQARAAINYNEMLEYERDHINPPVRAGDKVRRFYLRRNDFGMKAIAFPSELEHFPEWFDQYFSVDLEAHEEKLIDTKLEIYFKALQWEVPTRTSVLANSTFDMM